MKNSLKEDKKPLYISLYEYIKDDIENNRIKTNEKLPSKREMAEKFNISLVTVQNAYYQLLSEGYIYSIERSGFFVAETMQVEHQKKVRVEEIIQDVDRANTGLTLYKNTVNTNYFPFSTWAKSMRQVLSVNYETLLQKTDNIGVFELRKAISDFLYRQRDMVVNPNNIVIGAGTEYLYSMIIKLLGRDKTYAVETPGYPKMWQIYLSEKVDIEYIEIDDSGFSIINLAKTNANILHISPNHQFPSGIVMPYERRMELLNWAAKNEDRYIIEDDYDSEFRYATKPLPSLQSVDKLNKVIYINTFSKTIAPSLRISYMILPDELLQKYNAEFSFISNTVPTFEQFVLAKFISEKYLERYIKKTKKIYKNIRNEIITLIANSKLSDRALLNEQDAGLHFSLKLKTDKQDSELKKLAKMQNINLIFISDFMPKELQKTTSTLIISYTNFEKEEILKILDVLAEII